jgi:Acetyltransferase (GNAT) family
MVRVSLQISFPHVPDALLDKMADSMKSLPAPGADPSNPQSPTPEAQNPEQAAQSLDAVAAQFSKMAEGTTKTVNGRDYFLQDSRWHTKQDGKTFARQDDGKWKEVIDRSASAKFFARRLKPDDFANTEQGDLDAMQKHWDEVEAWTLKFDRDALDNYIASASVSQSIMKYGATGGVMRDGELLAAYDRIIQDDSIFVHSLAAHPRTIADKNFKSKGAGTQAIKQLVQISIEAGKNGKITLKPLDSAKSFYKKLGFVNREYTDGLDRILAARQNDDGSIVCIAQDGVKQISCEITDTRIRFRSIDSQAVIGQTAQMAAPENITLDFVDSAIDRLMKLVRGLKCPCCGNSLLQLSDRTHPKHKKYL